MIRARNDKEIKLADLKRFAESFKLHTPMPKDVADILSAGRRSRAEQSFTKDSGAPEQLTDGIKVGNKDGEEVEYKKEYIGYWANSDQSRLVVSGATLPVQGTEKEDRTDALETFRAQPAPEQSLTSYSQPNIWDQVPEIERYIGGIQQNRASKLSSNIVEIPHRVREQNESNPVVIIPPSSIYSSSQSAVTKTTLDTQTTAQTPISIDSNPGQSRKNMRPAVNTMEDIREPTSNSMWTLRNKCLCREMRHPDTMMSH